MHFVALFAEFFRIGLFAVGGGLAAVPFVYELAQRTRFVDAARISDFLAASQIVPGAIGINLAAYSGFDYLKTPGAYLAALGMLSPSIVIIITISFFYAKWKENRIFSAVFQGMRPASTGLIASVCALLLIEALYNKNAVSFFQGFRITECAVFIVILAAVIILKKHPVLYIAVGAAAGIIFKL